MPTCYTYQCNDGSVDTDSANSGGSDCVNGQGIDSVISSNNCIGGGNPAPATGAAPVTSSSITGTTGLSGILSSISTGIAQDFKAVTAPAAPNIIGLGAQGTLVNGVLIPPATGIASLSTLFSNPLILVAIAAVVYLAVRKK